ncbi:hypothetical protein [Bacillus sp. FSL K6-1284]|uniref:hypothetical protein n=1 Tax=Bacillus sp. FSL K6-1284 TaxID=2921468 RepID=UPI0030F9D279
MLHIINLFGRDLKTSGLEVESTNETVVFHDYAITLNGKSQQMEAIGFNLEGSTDRRILYKLYLIKKDDEPLNYHLTRVELDSDGFSTIDDPPDVIYLLAEIYIERDGTVAGVVYNSTDEVPYSKNADLMKLPTQFNIRVDESIFDQNDPGQERDEDVPEIRTGEH